MSTVIFRPSRAEIKKSLNNLLRVLKIQGLSIKNHLSHLVVQTSRMTE